MALRREYVVPYKKKQILIDLFLNSHSPLVKVATSDCCKYLIVAKFKQIAFDEK